MTDTVVQDPVAEAVQGLRDLADFIEANPDLDWGYAKPRVVVVTLERIAEFAAVPGGWDKNAYDNPGGGGNFELVRHFGPAELTVVSPREQVCEKVVLGTEKVQVPDPDAPMVTVDREVVRWECKPILGGDR